jgi:ParB-like chromosome segregation protein Spo0J
VVKSCQISIDDVLIGKDHRPLDPEAVAVIAASMKMIGQQTAIRVRAAPGQDGKAILVAGRRRIEAAKSLGWGTLRAEFIDGDELLAELCEIADDLHRSGLTALEEAEKLAKWVRLTTQCEAISRQKVAKSGPGRPEGVIAKAERELPIKGKTQQARRKAIERAIKIDAMSSDAKAAAIEVGLNNKRSALLEIAKEQGTEGQLEKIAEIVKRNAKKEVKRSGVKKSKAKAKQARRKAPAQKHPDDVIFAELRSQCSPPFRRTWARAPTKVRRRFLREILHWEGGKPASKSD